MAAKGKHREALLVSAVKLFRQQGYAATGLSEILTDSGAPKGSLYHYFPGGKSEIGAAAVTRAGETVAKTLQELTETSDTLADAVEVYLSKMAGWMAASNYRDGSPITTTLLETVPDHPAIQVAGQAAFASWTNIFTAKAIADGLPPDRAARIARLFIASMEGALLQCRLDGNDAPMKGVAAELRELYLAALSG